MGAYEGLRTACRSRGEPCIEGRIVSRWCDGCDMRNRYFLKAITNLSHLREYLVQIIEGFFSRDNNGRFGEGHPLLQFRRLPFHIIGDGIPSCHGCPCEKLQEVDPVRQEDTDRPIA